MTIKCKTIKATSDRLDEYVNNFLAAENVSELVHVTSSSSSGSSARFMHIFYKEGDSKPAQEEVVKKTATRGRKKLKPIESKEVSNG